MAADGPVTTEGVVSGAHHGAAEHDLDGQTVADRGPGPAAIHAPSVSSATTEWYERYYRARGHLRNSLLSNPEVLFQAFAQDAALIRSIARCSLDPASARVLDVGCGGGGSLLNLLRLGFQPNMLHGIDIQSDRIAEARARLPHVDLRCADAAALPYDEGYFDAVSESTMFVQITDDDLARAVAREMIRVVRPGGYLILSDWRYGGEVGR